MARSRIRWVVNCQIHGMKSLRNDPTKWLFVGAPRHKRERLTKGCPMCYKAHINDLKTG